jgi:hypothetical protein
MRILVPDVLFSRLPQSSLQYVIYSPEKIRHMHYKNTYRPAILPDTRRMIWYPLVVCGILSAAGLITRILPLAICPLCVMAIFPGIPVAIHTIYFLSVTITLRGNRLCVADYAGDPFVLYPRRQEISLPNVAYIYHLDKEAQAHAEKTTPSAPFANTRINMSNYRAADADPRRRGAVARTDNGLVLSDSEGRSKVYIMHFHDLSKKDWQQLARRFREINAGISFIMSANEMKGLVGQEESR